MSAHHTVALEQVMVKAKILNINIIQSIPVRIIHVFSPHCKKWLRQLVSDRCFLSTDPSLINIGCILIQQNHCADTKLYKHI